MSVVVALANDTVISLFPSISAVSYSPLFRTKTCFPFHPTFWVILLRLFRVRLFWISPFISNLAVTYSPLFRTKTCFPCFNPTFWVILLRLFQAHLTLAHHRVSSSSVVRGIRLDHRGSWIQVPSGAWIFSEFSLHLISCCYCFIFKTRFPCFKPSFLSHFTTFISNSFVSYSLVISAKPRFPDKNLCIKHLNYDFKRTYKRRYQYSSINNLFVGDCISCFLEKVTFMLMFFCKNKCVRNYFLLNIILYTDTTCSRAQLFKSQLALTQE
mgnify:CR=1 FL=1